MSQALLMAVKNPKFEESHLGYLAGDSDIIYGCAIGAVFAHILPRQTVMDRLDDDDTGRPGLIEQICAKIPGSCDKVPIRIWRKHCGYTGTAAEYKKYISTRWVDFIETLFEQKDLDFEEIAEVLKQYDK